MNNISMCRLPLLIDWPHIDRCYDLPSGCGEFATFRTGYRKNGHDHQDAWKPVVDTLVTYGFLPGIARSMTTYWLLHYTHITTSDDQYQPGLPFQLDGGLYLQEQISSVMTNTSASSLSFTGSSLRAACAFFLCVDFYQNDSRV